MTRRVDAAALARFAALLEARFGLRAEPSRERDLAAALEARLDASGCAGPDGYFAGLADPAFARRELGAIAALVTIGETYFFRHPEQFRAFAEVALPDRLRVNAGRRRLRVLSAGCASGEEPYSLAMLLADRAAALAGWELDLLGVDLNPQAIARARGASFGAWSMRGVLESVRERFFTHEAGSYKLDPRVANLTRFEERNLTADDASFWRPGTFDVVFCRNVLIYFGPETTRAVIARIAGALAPGGYLFLGPAESLREVSDDFHLLHTHGCFYYQRKGTVAPLDMLPAASPAERLDTALVPERSAVPADDWAERIARAAERVEGLASRQVAAPVPVSSTWQDALASFRAERFTEALERLEEADARTGEALLLRAAILTNAGRVSEAERACREAIAHDELDPGAHYLLALCREQAGDLEAAVRHDEAALYLAPGFAMPHLHLGLLSRRRGDLPAARRAFELALELLPNEPPDRLTLFGGGFSCEGLMSLCRAQLAGGGA